MVDRLAIVCQLAKNDSYGHLQKTDGCTDNPVVRQTDPCPKLSTSSRSCSGSRFKVESPRRLYSCKFKAHSRCVFFFKNLDIFSLRKPQSLLNIRLSLKYVAIAWNGLSKIQTDRLERFQLHVCRIILRLSLFSHTSHSYLLTTLNRLTLSSRCSYHLALLSYKNQPPHSSKRSGRHSFQTTCTTLFTQTNTIINTHQHHKLNSIGNPSF